ncbi:hypothetical protein QCM80_06030 [Bradyrhizobium sp. SSUT112]|uniref:hypothetical protein n=1 Tax=Bradyrhizobium sp. SSUT112 TaxID=3040604 RepID=UPI0024499E5F|nr:hypothetical protein [Bradyrhizobium sp. SSUT112]MDH2350239.1 hypothetical protein [Bradyrhizobium sp. SSUT112]
MLSYPAMKIECHPVPADSRHSIGFDTARSLLEERIMMSRALAVALLLALPSGASAQVPVRFGFPNGAPWCAFGFDCRFLNYRECADRIYDPAQNCLKDPYFAAHYPTDVDKGWSFNRR